MATPVTSAVFKKSPLTTLSVVVTSPLTELVAAVEVLTTVDENVKPVRVVSVLKSTEKVTVDEPLDAASLMV